MNWVYVTKGSVDTIRRFNELRRAVRRTIHHILSPGSKSIPHQSLAALLGGASHEAVLAEKAGQIVGNWVTKILDASLQAW